MDPVAIARILAVFAALYAALCAIRWGRMVAAEPRVARQQGLVLNLARRAAPPVIGGLILTVAGLALGVGGAGAVGALLVSGGLAYGLHRGLDELHQNDRQVLALRVAVALGIGLAILWQTGLI